MPAKGLGYRNLSISAPVYRHYRGEFNEKKAELARQGITSFTGYITSLLEPQIERDEFFVGHRPALEEFGLDEERGIVYVKDNRTNRVAGVTIIDKGFKCDVDGGRDDCIHVGFAFALSATYRMMEKAGAKSLILKDKREQVRGRVPPLRGTQNRRPSINAGREA